MNEKQKRIVEMAGTPEAEMHMKLFCVAMDGDMKAYNQIMEIAYGKE